MIDKQAKQYNCWKEKASTWNRRREKKKSTNAHADKIVTKPDGHQPTSTHRENNNTFACCTASIDKRDCRQTNTYMHWTIQTGGTHRHAYIHTDRQIDMRLYAFEQYGWIAHRHTCIQADKHLCIEQYRLDRHRRRHIHTDTQADRLTDGQAMMP